MASKSTMTGIIFDESMSEYCCQWDPTYVEKPDRFQRVLKRFQELDLVERCVNLKPRKATEAEILTNHNQELLDFMRNTIADDEDELRKKSSKYDCVYIHPLSYPTALLSAGSALELTDAVMKGKIKNGFALIRPPGHHATHDEICGYCYFNNVAISAKMALAQGLERILIVDWDVHHGQATQRAFYDDPRVLYFSIHRHEFGTWWPNLKESDFDHIGEKSGKGFNVNIPLNKIGNTDSDYLAAFLDILMPIANEFNPELVLVSAGYDPALGCIEGEQEVSPACFAQMTHLVTSLANGKVVALLEGGYFLTSLAESAAHTVKVLLGDPCPKLPNPIGKPCDEMAMAIQNVKIVLRPFWKCFQAEIHDPFLEPQTQWLGPNEERPTEFDTMCPTPLRDPKIEQDFEDQMKFLIQTTNLDFSTCRLAMGCQDYENINPYLWPFQEQFSFLEPSSLTVEQLQWLQINFHDVQKSKAALGSIYQVMDSVLTKESQAGVCVLQQCIEEDFFDLVTFYAKEKYNVDKILVVYTDDQLIGKKYSSGNNDENENVLKICLRLETNFETNSSCFDEDFEEKNENCVNLDFGSQRKDHSTSLVQALFRIIMKIGYEFDPSLVIFHTDITSNLFGQESISSFTHCLSGLANGKFVAVFESSSGPFDNSLLIAETVRTSLKVGVKSAKSFPEEKNQTNSIEKCLQGLKKEGKWKTLN